ncbi:hypothetical protein [Nocardioides dongkuii]|uniref:hypothetical protein n=1 Tax=Nocardioides dongkuii TaxID=2760089 RepID=UPI0015F8788F|nr:hypothetical protein [Nocardioides dongkuii]
MTGAQTMSFGIEQTSSGETVLVDRACGSCAACLAGSSLHCSAPLANGRVLTAPVPAQSANELLSAVLAAAALAEAPEASTVVVVATESTPLAVVVRTATRARVLVTPDLADAGLRAELADLEPSGRARVVVAGTDARAAVKAVRRGGHVCVGDATATMPSVTELVQREVTLVAPRDAAAVLARISSADWSAAVDAAAS